MNMDQTAQAEPISWPRNLQASRTMAYESLDLLYEETPAGAFGEQFGFVLSCSCRSLAQETNQKAMLHKLEVVTLPDFARGRLEITHEVLPGLGASAQIIPANETLKVACFDKGCIIPIKNFGYKKTFNSDVRARLSHHSGQIYCLATNFDGTRLASGCNAGEITLYDICGEEISFFSRTTLTHSSSVVAMSFLHSSTPSPAGHYLVYASEIGQVCLMDTRCTYAVPAQCQVLSDIRPRISVSSLLYLRHKSNDLVYLGSADGEIAAYDLRKSNAQLCEFKPDPARGTIKRMKEIVIQDGDVKEIFIAFSNSTNKLTILDANTLEPSKNWKCDRLPEGNINDLIQVGDRVVTCGEQTSIGCWYWDRQPTLK